MVHNYTSCLAHSYPYLTPLPRQACEIVLCRGSVPMYNKRKTVKQTPCCN